VKYRHVGTGVNELDARVTACDAVMPILDSHLILAFGILRYTLLWTRGGP
jgi:hypothetical protein